MYSFKPYIISVEVSGGNFVEKEYIRHNFYGENSMAKSKEYESFNVAKADNGYVVYVGQRNGNYHSAEVTFVFKTPAEVGNFIKEQVAKM